MALTNQQVQAAYLAIIGRPAEGSAVTWAIDSFADLASLVSSIIDIRKGGDFSNSKETFVENLYQNLLGRASDAEGKEFWLKALNDGASYAQVAQGFINAVLGQSQTEDLYKLQNKLDVAEKISAQIPSFTGSEANLVQIMSNVAADTKIEDLSNDLEQFKGQNVNVASVSVNTAADNDTATEGSEEHASVFNATVSILDNKISTEESSLLLNGSTNYKDTLNLTLKSSKDTKGKQNAVDLGDVLANVSGIKVINLNVKDNNIAGVSGEVKDFDLKIDGTSQDTISVSGRKTVDTGAGNDTITVKGAATVIAGAGNDGITLDKDNASGTTISIDGGAGRDTVTFSGDDNNADYKKVTLSSIEILAGKGTVSKTLLDGKSYDLASGADLKVAAANGIDLGKISMVTDVTDGKISIDGVASGTVKLSAKDASIKETITLAADAKNNVIVTNTASGDKVDVSELAYAGNTFASAATGAKFETKKGFNIDLKGVSGAKSVDGYNLDTLKAYMTDSNFEFTTSASNNEALVFITNTGDSTEKTGIYLVKGGAANAKTVESVQLIATVDQDIQASGVSLTANTIVFA